MTILEFASLIQAIGTFFLVGTFVLYWYQLKVMQRQLEVTLEQFVDNTKTNQASQYQTALQLIFDWRSEVIQNPKLSEHLKDEPYFKDVFSTFSPEVYFHTMKLFHIFEFFWLLSDRKIVDEKIWGGWKKNLQIVMGVSKNRRLWEKVRSAFNVEFVNLVDSEIRKIEEAAGKV